MRAKNNNMNERKAFQKLSAEENPQFWEDGMEIYDLFLEKYPEPSIENLDNILNGLCASLTILMRINVDKDNHRQFIQLIYKILMDNVK
jgi:hypothetical protein